MESTEDEDEEDDNCGFKHAGLSFVVVWVEDGAAQEEPDDAN